MGLLPAYLAPRFGKINGNVEGAMRVGCLTDSAPSADGGSAGDEAARRRYTAASSKFGSGRPGMMKTQNSAVDAGPEACSGVAQQYGSSRAAAG